MSHYSRDPNIKILHSQFLKMLWFIPGKFSRCQMSFCIFFWGTHWMSHFQPHSPQKRQKTTIPTNKQKVHSPAKRGRKNKKSGETHDYYPETNSKFAPENRQKPMNISNWGRGIPASYVCYRYISSQPYVHTKTTNHLLYL